MALIGWLCSEPQSQPTLNHASTIFAPEKWACPKQMRDTKTHASTTTPKNQSHQMLPMFQPRRTPWNLRQLSNLWLLQPMLKVTLFLLTRLPQIIWESNHLTVGWFQRQSLSGPLTLRSFQPRPRPGPKLRTWSAKTEATNLPASESKISSKKSSRTQPENNPIGPK